MRFPQSSIPTVTGSRHACLRKPAVTEHRISSDASLRRIDILTLRPKAAITVPPTYAVAAYQLLRSAY